MCLHHMRQGDACCLDKPTRKFQRPKAKNAYFLLIQSPVCALLAGGMANSTSYSHPGTKELEVVPLSTSSKAILGRRAPGKEGQGARELLPRRNCLGPKRPDFFRPILLAGCSRKAPLGGRVTAVPHTPGESPPRSSFEPLKQVTNIWRNGHLCLPHSWQLFSTPPLATFQYFSIIFFS